MDEKWFQEELGLTGKKGSDIFRSVSFKTDGSGAGRSVR